MQLAFIIWGIVAAEILLFAIYGVQILALEVSMRIDDWKWKHRKPHAMGFNYVATFSKPYKEPSCRT